MSRTALSNARFHVPRALLLLAVAASGCTRDGLPVTGDLSLALDAATDLASDDLAPLPDLAVPLVSDCREAAVQFVLGADNLQFVVWIEDARGHYIDTVFLTALTGLRGLGNRPGSALLKTDRHWPYGRREMVLPVWAHRRNHLYPKVVMGGACGNSPQSICPDTKMPCGGDCDDTTIMYHSRVESSDPYYCRPYVNVNCGGDVISKGAYANGGATSLYPPRADLIMFSPNDSLDALGYAKEDDLAALSGATPAARTILPPFKWRAGSGVDGDYVLWIELSDESDFNAANNHPNQHDSVQAWDFVGNRFLGQPSVVYSVPFHLGPGSTTTATHSFAGYSTWDGSDGVLHLPDGTASDAPGTGAGRLLDQYDGSAPWRIKVIAGPCGK